ncbi:MAG: tyrosine-type recombinase/integrase [Devosia sp.]
MAIQFIQKRGKAWRYRRRVPTPLQPLIGKTEIICPLGSSEAEALRLYPKVHAHAEWQLAQAALPQRPRMAPTAVEMHKLAHSLVAESGLSRSWDGWGDPYDREGAAREAFADRVVEKYQRDDEGHPVDITPQDEALLHALSAGARDQRPAPTLEDARRQYLADAVGDNEKRQKQLARIFALVADVVKLDTTLPDLRRVHARDIRDHMLDGRKPSSAQRYLNTLKAVLNHAIREFELGQIVNPFSNLPVGNKEEETPDRRKRDVFTGDELAATRAHVMTSQRADLRLIWRLLELTGCRLSEITGLRLIDVRLNHAIPHIAIEGHETRRIKTLSSWRLIPLLGDALDAAREAINGVEANAVLFPAYCRKGGPNSASAALGKHVRACVIREEVTTYSLRHGMADRLDLAGVSQRDRDLVLGHTRGKASETYGGEVARLQLAHRALEKALAVPPAPNATSQP